MENEESIVDIISNELNVNIQTIDELKSLYEENPNDLHLTQRLDILKKVAFIEERFIYLKLQFDKINQLKEIYKEAKKEYLTLFNQENK